MNDASTTIPSHRPSITRFQPVVYPSMDYLRPLIRDEDILWIRATYIANIKLAGSRYTLHCNHWAKIVHLKLDYIEDNVILLSKRHSVCRVAGFYIDIFNNAILSGFNWEFEGFKEDSSFRIIDPTDPTDPTGVDRKHIIHKYYNEPIVSMRRYIVDIKEYTVRKEDRDWMCSIYKHIIHPNKELKLVSCNSWGLILYSKLNYIENREIQTNNKHTVLVAHKVYIDLECNAYLFNFDWKTQVWHENIRVVPINEEFPVEYEYLSRFYAEKAIRLTKIHYYNKELEYNKAI